jgi:hypothetical protein
LIYRNDVTAVTDGSRPIWLQLCRIPLDAVVEFCRRYRRHQIPLLVSARSSAFERADAEHTAAFAPRKFMIPARSRLHQAEQCRM